MRAILYIAANEVALDFETEADRDKFHTNLASNASGGFSPQEAAVKVGDKTIRFHPDGFKVGYQWAVQFIPRTQEKEDPKLRQFRMETKWLCLSCTIGIGQAHQWSYEFLAGIGSACSQCGQSARVQRINVAGPVK